MRAGVPPAHERVKSGELASYRGWDGEFGPFIEKVGTDTFANFVTIERSDYVSNALAGLIRVSLTAEVQSEDLIARHQALKTCERILGLKPNVVTCLVVFRKIANWATSNPGSPKLQGGGFLLIFAELSGIPVSTAELNRVHQKVKRLSAAHTTEVPLSIDPYVFEVGTIALDRDNSLQISLHKFGINEIEPSFVFEPWRNAARRWNRVVASDRYERRNVRYLNAARSGTGSRSTSCKPASCPSSLSHINQSFWPTKQWLLPSQSSFPVDPTRTVIISITEISLLVPARIFEIAQSGSVDCTAESCSAIVQIGHADNRTSAFPSIH